MPISGIGHNEKVIHVIRGQESPALVDHVTKNKSLIWFEGTNDFDAGNYLSKHADVTLTFRPLFKGTQQPGTQYIGNGVSFDISTGVLQVDQVHPVGSLLRNFILEIKATDNSGADPEEHLEYIRYELHDSIINAWLTPNTLLIPRNIKSYRFSIFAEFDDGIIGDMTNVKGIVWSSPNGNRNIGRFDNVKIDANDDEKKDLVITATLPAEFQNAEAKGKIKIAKAYDDSKNQLTIKPVTTGNSPGYKKRNEVTNVLFISEGFQTSDEGAFDIQIDNLVEKLSKDAITIPYNYLSESINFWKLFIPSPDTYAGWHSEIYFNEYIFSSGHYAKEVPFAKVTPNPTSEDDVEDWELENLIFFAGLPVPELKTQTTDQVRARWISLMRLNDDSATNQELVMSIKDGLIEDWIELADRRLLEETDTFMGLYHGIRPKTKLEEKDDTDSFHFNFGRNKRHYLNDIFANAVDPSNNPMANLWESGNDNYDLVIFLTNQINGRVHNGTGYMIVPASNSNSYPEIEAVPSLEGVTGAHKAVRIKHRPVPNEIPIGNRGTFFHELCHSFGLGDEYGEKIEDVNHHYFNYNGFAGAVDKYGNLEHDSTIRSGGDINGNLIKWRWHRIEKCAVLNANVTGESNDRLKIPTKENQSKKFALDDEIFLRERIKNKPLDRNPRLSKLLKIISIENDHLICELKTHMATDYADAQTFGTDNIVYKPKKAEGDAFDATNFPYAEMMTKNIRDFITAEKRPLTPEVCEINNDFEIVPDDLPGVDLCYKNKPKIIGLYAGGFRHHCNVYHPSGTCLMRSLVKISRLTELCAVCRYVMTDWVDPSKHPEVDAHYNVYPEL